MHALVRLVHLVCVGRVERNPREGSGGRGRPGEQLLGLVAADPADDLDPALEIRVLGELDDGSGRAFTLVWEGEHESRDVALEERSDTHHARLDGREDRCVGQSFAAETPHALFDSPVTAAFAYDVARDGSGFYVAGYEAGRTSPIVFVSDITADLRPGANAH